MDGIFTSDLQSTNDRFEKLWGLGRALPPPDCSFLGDKQQWLQYEDYRDMNYFIWLSNNNNFSITVTSAAHAIGDNIKLSARGQWICIHGKVYLIYENRHWICSNGMDIPVRESNLFGIRLPETDFFLPYSLACNNSRLQIMPPDSAGKVSALWSYFNCPAARPQYWLFGSDVLLRSPVGEPGFHRPGCGNKMQLPGNTKRMLTHRDGP